MKDIRLKGIKVKGMRVDSVRKKGSSRNNALKIKLKKFYLSSRRMKVLFKDINRARS